MIGSQVCRSKVGLDMCPDDNRKGRGFLPEDFFQFLHLMWISFYHFITDFITIVSQIFH